MGKIGKWTQGSISQPIECHFTDLHPVGKPIALGVSALDGKEHISTWDHAAFWDSFDFDGEVTIILLKVTNSTYDSARKCKDLGPYKQRT